MKFDRATERGGGQVFDNCIYVMNKAARSAQL